MVPRSQVGKRMYALNVGSIVMARGESLEMVEAAMGHEFVVG